MPRIKGKKRKKNLSAKVPKVKTVRGMHVERRGNRACSGRGEDRERVEPFKRQDDRRDAAKDRKEAKGIRG